MKIIKEGKRSENVTYRGSCIRCKTEVEFDRHEATKHSDPRDGDYLNVDCPVCGNEISVQMARRNVVE